MWFTFPRLKSSSRSSISDFYGISGKARVTLPPQPATLGFDYLKHLPQSSSLPESIRFTKKKIEKAEAEQKMTEKIAGFASAKSGRLPSRIQIHQHFPNIISLLGRSIMNGQPFIHNHLFQYIHDAYSWTPKNGCASITRKSGKNSSLK